MKENIIEKAQRRLAINFPDYSFDADIIGDFFDDACGIIRGWKKLTNDNALISGDYDRNIIQFIVESINMAGLEGQSSSSANGVTKAFINSPEANLKSSIPQCL